MAVLQNKKVVDEDQSANRNPDRKNERTAFLEASNKRSEIENGQRNNTIKNNSKKGDALTKVVYMQEITKGRQ